MKAHSLNSYLLYLALISLLMLGAVGVKTLYDVNNIEKSFAKAHENNARSELARGVDNLLTRIDGLAKSLANWDETSQQITDPTYYMFWRERRVHAVHYIPGHVAAIDLYNSAGKILAESKDGMPSSVPEIKRYLWIENKRPWLLIFTPIFSGGEKDAIFGYVGMKIDFLMALLDLNRFLHIDPSSVTMSSMDAVPILVSDIPAMIDLQEIHHGDLDSLKDVVYTSLGYFVLLVVIMVLLLYWLVVVLFARPLRYLDSYVRQDGDRHLKNESGGLPFPVTEFNSFAASIVDYKNQLAQSQQSLSNMNTQLEQRVRDRTVELEAVNEELEAFSYSVSHDLRTPLRSLDGFSQVLLEDYANSLDARGQDYLNRVRTNAQHMGRLVDDLLNLARISRKGLSLTRVNLSALANEVLNQLKLQEPLRVVSVSIADNLYVEGDEQLMYVLMGNLLQNAWKYSSHVEHSSIEFGKVKNENEAEFYVKDNGVGFDMRYAKKIFEPFERLRGDKFEGTGIGLATVSRILKRHQGRIWVEASPGQGACFYFSIPNTHSSDLAPIVVE